MSFNMARHCSLHTCAVAHLGMSSICGVGHVDDIQRSIMSCEEIRARIIGTEESDKAFQEDYGGNLYKLRCAVKNGEIVMPTREELGDWLRQSSWRIMA